MIRLVLGLLIILSLLMTYYDYFLYGEGIVPVPFISVVIATILAFIYLMMNKCIRKSPIKIVREFRYILFFFFAMQLSVFGLCFGDPTNEKLFQFFKTNLHLLFYVLFVFVLIQLLNKPLFQRLLRFYYICGIMLASFGILQFIHLNFFQIYGIDQFLFGSTRLYNMGLSRAASIFVEPSFFSYFLVDWIGIGLAYTLTREPKKELILCIALLSALFCTASMGGYIALSALIFLVSYEFPNIRRRLCLVSAIFIPIMIYGFVYQFFIEPIGSRITAIVSGVDPSAAMRLDSAQAALQVWLRNPIVGVGIGNASFYTGDFYTGIWWLYIQDPSFHIAIDVAFLNILAESGVIGIIAFIIMAVVVVKQPWSERFLKPILYRESLSEETNRNSSDGALWIFTKIFRIIVIVNFIELFLCGALLLPRFWFNIGVYLFLKARLRKKLLASHRPLFGEIGSTR